MPQERSLSDSEIEEALARVLASPSFRRARRPAAFLNYVTRETLAHRSAGLKAYVIATDALNAPVTFEADSDPLVRVTAYRARRALAEYYESGGRDDAVMIGLEPGSYQPSFRRRGADDTEIVARMERDPLLDRADLAVSRNRELRTDARQLAGRAHDAVSKLLKTLASIKARFR
jgi:hypothetical protein